MTAPIRIRKTRQLTGLLTELLAEPIPVEMARLLAGKKRDGTRFKGRPRKGTLPELPEGATFGDALVLSLVLRGIAGDTSATKVIINHTEGTPLRRSVVASFSASIDTDLAGLMAKLGEPAGMVQRVAQLRAAPADDPDDKPGA